MPDVVDVRALAQDVIKQHTPVMLDKELCRTCGYAPWPCLPRRLADAVLAQHNQQHALIAERDSLRDERDNLNEMLKDACRRFEWHESQGWPRYVRDRNEAALGDRATPNTETP